MELFRINLITVVNILFKTTDVRHNNSKYQLKSGAYVFRCKMEGDNITQEYRVDGD